jgi:hypothetical protein
LHAQSPEQVITELPNQISKLEKQQQYLDASKWTEIESRLQLLESQQKLQIAPPQSDNHTYIASTFQPPTPTVSSPSPEDNDMCLLIKANTLADYLEGMMKLKDIQTIDSYNDNDGMWHYSAVTISNTAYSLHIKKRTFVKNCIQLRHFVVILFSLHDYMIKLIYKQCNNI